MAKPAPRTAARSASSTTRDNSTLVTIVIGLLLTAVSFAGTWFFQQHRHQAALAELTSTYASPVPVITQTGEHSVAAKFVIRTSLADIAWVEANRKALEQVFQSALAQTDMKRVLAPGGLLTLQERLREEGNAALQTDKLQEVLLTDFLVGDTSE